MKNKNQPNCDQDKSPLADLIGQEIHLGVSRRSVLRGMMAGGVMAATAGGLMSLAGTAYAQTPVRGGRIKVATGAGSAADTLDPAKGSNYTDYTRAFMFYNGLTVLDQQMSPQMSLATAFDTNDAITWSVKLRNDIIFHDGGPFTSADVVYSLTRHNDPQTASKAASVAQQIEEVKAVGPHEVVIRLVSANADLPAILGTAHFLIVRDGTTDFSKANGTGPFKCAEFEPGLRSIGVRNENYWKPGQPYLDEVELFTIPDEAARVNALLAGDVDLINPVNARSVTRILNSGHATVQEAPTSAFTNLVMRDELSPMQNPDFSLAMKYLMDRETIHQVGFRGFGTIANDHPVAPGHRYHFGGLPQRPYDLDKAKYYLEKSGMAGRTIPLVASEASTGSVEIAQLMQLSAQQIGLKLDIKRVSADGYWSNHWMKHPLHFGSVSARPTVDLIFSLFYKSDAAWNQSQWKNDQLDQLLVAARGETDEVKRKQMYADMQILIHEECGTAIPQFNSSLDGHNVKIKGYGAHPLGGLMGYMFAEHVWLEA